MFALDPEEIQRSCRRVTWDGLDLLCLGGHDQVIYLMVHAVKHNLERLIWLADIQRLVAAWQAADWEGLRQRAGELGQERVPAVLAYLRQELFGMPTPAAATAGLTLSAVQRHLLRMRKRGPLPKWSSLMLLTAGNRVRQLEFALESMFPRPEILRQVFTDRLDLGDFVGVALTGPRLRQAGPATMVIKAFNPSESRQDAAPTVEASWLPLDVTPKVGKKPTHLPTLSKWRRHTAG